VNQPSDHPDRFVLADEVHARPPEPLETPSRLSYMAVLVDPDARAGEFARLVQLCERMGVTPPPPGVTQFVTPVGSVRLKWERHGEFSAYTVIAPAVPGLPFAETAASLLPAHWLREVPGTTMVSAHAVLLPAGDAPPTESELAPWFLPGASIVGADLAEGAGYAFTDFRIHPDGSSRFVLLNRGFTVRQAGRMAQRLFEIEAYRMLALLALPIARRQSPRINAIEKSLAVLMDGIARDAGTAYAGDEALLQELTRLAAEIESGLAASQFRFGACRAYADLVRTRITDLREQRIPGIQTIGEFMTRRFEPAVTTCTTVSQRLRDLSDRVAQASALLSTRVDIVRERQNQALLGSMDRRAKLQLRLQQTVEGLSVAAITYYAVGLIGYLAKGFKAAGVRIDPDLATGVAVPLIAGTALWMLRRVRRRIARSEGAEAH
jgi:uncharacterized membrane-anchored protein